MNERIKKLAEQALRDSTTTPLDGVYRAEGYAPSVSKVFADRFAALIVADVIREMSGMLDKDEEEIYYTIDRLFK
jgi:hypothetical protein